MSMQRECRIVEYRRKQWYLFVAIREHGDVSYTDTTSVGPFNSEEETDQYLDDFFSNPGGVTIYKYGKPTSEFTHQLHEYLVKHAEKPQERSTW